MGWRGPLTDRQYAVWTAWLDEQWNHPELTDHYIMKLCSVYVNSKLEKGSWVKPEDFQSKFTVVKAGDKKNRYGDIDPNDPIKPVTKEIIQKFGKVRMGGGR